MNNKLIENLNKDLQYIQNGNIPNICAGLVLNNIFKWKAIILGPINTPYEGGIFKIFISIPKKYPFEPPTIIFKTKIYHPNIDSSGNICSDLFNTQWSPAFKISHILLYISFILSEPDINNCSVPDIANILKNNPELYRDIAKEHTRIYA